MTGGALAPYPGPPDTTTLYMQQTANIAASPAAYQTLYPGVDNRYPVFWRHGPNLHQSLAFRYIFIFLPFT